jgi:hypothetical protein
MNWERVSLIVATMGTVGGWNGLAGQTPDKQPLAEEVFKNVQVLREFQSASS